MRKFGEKTKKRKRITTTPGLGLWVRKDSSPRVLKGMEDVLQARPQLTWNELEHVRRSLTIDSRKFFQIAEPLGDVQSCYD